MGGRQQALRSSLGQALRRYRQGTHLSLDDVERSTAKEGVRVTRSHLSRVETGQADIALSRYLSLIRALGISPERATGSLAPLLEGGSVAPRELRERLAGVIGKGDPQAIARLCRALHARDPRILRREEALAWAGAEARLGRWSAAARAFRRALPTRPTRQQSARLALAHLAAGHPGLAELLCGEAPEAVLVAAACALGRRENRRALEQLESLGPGAGDGDDLFTDAATSLRAQAFRLSGKRQAALRLASARSEHRIAEESAARVELLAELARCLAARRRPAAGLRILGRARAAARRLRHPALLARIEFDEALLQRAAGERGRAAAAERRGRAVLRRAAADAGRLGTLPLYGLLELLERS